MSKWRDRKRITDAELRTLKAAAVILSLPTLTGILRRSGANRLGAAEVLSTTFRCEGSLSAAASR